MEHFTTVVHNNVWFIYDNYKWNSCSSLALILRFDKSE